eukprot:gene10210-11301_t
MNRKEKNIIKTKKNYEEEKDEEDIINNPSSSSSSRSMFQEGFTERYDLEQYFWTMDTVHRLLVGLSHTTDCCCLTTPSLGVGFHEQGREEAVLDIDTRFAYLPKFQYYDLRHPITLEETFSIIVMDPPFFYLPLEVIRDAVLMITKGRLVETKLMIGFLKREEKALLEVFRDFKLRETNFELEYATVRPNKWKNYRLYSNVDLPGIKRIRSK